MLTTARSSVFLVAHAFQYRRILVPVQDNRESEQALDVSCRLAGEHGAVITTVVVVEVPSLLPLDAHMTEEERAAHRLLERAGAVADSYGVRVSPRIVRGRDAASAILEEAEAAASEIVIIGSPRKGRAYKGPRIFGGTVEHVLKRARCRVMVIGAPAKLYEAHAAA